MLWRVIALSCFLLEVNGLAAGFDSRAYNAIIGGNVTTERGLEEEKSKIFLREIAAGRNRYEVAAALYGPWLDLETASHGRKLTKNDEGSVAKDFGDRVTTTIPKGQYSKTYAFDLRGLDDKTFVTIHHYSHGALLYVSQGSYDNEPASMKMAMKGPASWEIWGTSKVKIYKNQTMTISEANEKAIEDVPCPASPSDAFTSCVVRDMGAIHCKGGGFAPHKSCLGIRDACACLGITRFEWLYITAHCIGSESCTSDFSVSYTVNDEVRFDVKTRAMCPEVRCDSAQVGLNSQGGRNALPLPAAVYVTCAMMLIFAWTSIANR